MAYIPDQQINTGSFVPTTNIWDVANIANMKADSPEFKDLIVRLYQNINNIALVLNRKDSAYYLLEEFASGQVYFNPNSTDPLDLRPGFRKMVIFGEIDAGITAVNHGLLITDAWKFIFIEGAASNTMTLEYYPLPFAGAANNNIEITVNSTQVIINNNSGTTFTDGYVVLVYVKF